MDSIRAAIDKAQAKCEPSTRRALAEQIGTAETNLSSAYKGTRKLTYAQLVKLCELTGDNALLLYGAQATEFLQVRLQRQAGASSVGAMLSAFLAAVLIAGASGLSPSQASEFSAKNASSVMHIVGVMRQMAERLLGLFRRSRPSRRDAPHRNGRNAQSSPHLVALAQRTFA